MKTVSRLFGLMAALLLATTMAPLSAKASIADPSLAPTPYQGWNTYYGLGGDFTEDEVIEMAQSMIDRGLLAAGYDIIWLDGGWQADDYRDADGNLRPDPDQFPSGMKALTDTLHSMGFRAGIYTDAGAKLSDACGVGSGGGYQQRDADLFAEWGFDAIKVDFVCGWANGEDPEPAFRAMADAVRNNASGRDMIFNLCNPVTSPYWGDYPEHMQSLGSWAYAPEIAESWRTYTDVGWVGSILFTDVLRNYDANARHPEVAGPGHWNDPDYLGPELGMTDTEFRSQMSLWAIAAAPLVIASDVRSLSDTSVRTLTDPDVLAVNQDPLGYQARRIVEPGAHEVWVKEMADGSRVVALLNRSTETAEIATMVSSIGLKGQRVTVRDLWSKDVSEAQGTIRATVPGHGTVLLRIDRATGTPQTSRIVVGQPGVSAMDGTPIGGLPADILAGAGQTMQVSVPVYNDGTHPSGDVTLGVDLAEGWTVAGDTALGTIQPGKSVRAGVQIAIPDDASLGLHELEITVQQDGVTASRGLISVTVAPPSPTGTVNLAHHPWVSATSGWLRPTIDRSVGGWTPLIIDGVTYETGIGIASPSRIRYFLGGECSTLSGAAGVDDAVKFADQGATVTYQVEGDGRTLMETDVVRRDQLVDFKLDVTGIRDLQLFVTDAGDGGYNDRANWINLEIDCN